MNKRQLAIITTEPVDTTFDNQPVYIHAEILPVSDDPINQKRVYKVRTDLVGYEEFEVEELDPDNELVKVIKQKLVVLEEKQKWSPQTFSYDQINQLAIQMEGLIPEGLSRTERDVLELKTMFLFERKAAQPWGIPAEKWKIREESDLIK